MKEIAEGLARRPEGESQSLLFAEMQPIFATFVANLPIISVKSLSLCQVLTKVTVFSVG